MSGVRAPQHPPALRDKGWFGTRVIHEHSARIIENWVSPSTLGAAHHAGNPRDLVYLPAVGSSGGESLAELPTGTVTFLFTDLEGSTRVWEEHPEEMRDALAHHDAILREAIESHGGAVFSEMGDGMAAAFGSAGDAVAAGLRAQLDLGAFAWGETGALRARMGLHADEAALRPDGQYVNQPLNRCARLMAIAHGGQVVVSETVESLVRGALPSGAGLLPLGEHRLRDLARPIAVFQVVHPALPRDFPPLRSLVALPGNLPVQVTSFVGRHEELARVGGELAAAPVVTLTGVDEMTAEHPVHHPFHVHGAGRMLLLSRDGAPKTNLVWKDTVLVRAGETVRADVQLQRQAAPRNGERI
jgi:class 3 adenylate cyclase